VAHRGQWAAAEDLNVSWKWNVGQVHEALAGRLVPPLKTHSNSGGAANILGQKCAVISSACAAAGAPALSAWDLNCWVSSASATEWSMSITALGS
jgi:hypothetical protein